MQTKPSISRLDLRKVNGSGSLIPTVLSQKRCASMETDSTTGNRDGLAIIAKYAKIPPERVTYHFDSGTEILERIDRGLLFVMAFWSGPSFQSLVAITEILADLDPSGCLEFVVLDTDGATELHDHPGFKNRLHGCGEIAWIRNGTIVVTTEIGFNPQDYRRNTESLLAIP